MPVLNIAEFPYGYIPGNILRGRLHLSTKLTPTIGTIDRLFISVHY